MVILHIARIRNNPTNGVCVLVPKLVRAQKDIATVGLLNLSEFHPEDIAVCFHYSKPFSFKKLEAPFDKPDIVIFHQIYEMEFLEISTALHRKKIPYIILPHGSLTKEAQKIKRIKKLFGNFLFRSFFNQAAAIQCLTETEFENTETKIQKIIGKSGWNLPSTYKESFSEKRIDFVYIGRLEYYIKGLDIMLDAFKLVKDSPYRDKCRLHIYGPDYQGRFAHVQEMIAERGLDELVALHPPVFELEKEKVLLASDVFIQTSRSEALTLGIMEALGYGVPCLVTPGTTWGDYIEKYNAGWVAYPTPSSVFDKIVCAINENKRFYEISRNTRVLIKDNFSWEKNAEDAIKKYQCIIENRGG